MDHPIVKLIELKMVANSRFKSDESVCHICKNPLSFLCKKCEDGSQSNKVCYTSIGKCQHTFHYHCISSWLETDTNCPIDFTPFNYIGEMRSTDDYERSCVIRPKASN